ncbi:MAG: hypothetical protein HY706_12575 [Candidatus Hydrogenedentes bacterium]|nr:hypothetical protein [Candidatus Hydrogenedentota bacterium]
MDYEAYLNRQLPRIFPDPSMQARVRQELARYGTESYEREVPRVHLCILKLCSGNAGKVRELVEMAKQDYRDVIAWAQYPAQMQSDPSITDPDAKRRILDKDMQQFVQWLEEDV